MGFLQNFLHQKSARSTVLLDISARSVAGAYVRYCEGQVPTIIYARRLSVEVRGNEPESQAMMRTLKTLVDSLTREGGALLVRAVGSGRIERVHVSIDSPWQKTAVRTEHFEQTTPFVFNRRMVAAALNKNRDLPPGYVRADESIIGTTLNGYETNNPYGKEAHRAAVSILTSCIQEIVATEVQAYLRSAYHTKEIVLISASSLRYQAMRSVFPHEREALIVDAFGVQTSIALVRGGILSAIIETTDRRGSVATWLKDIAAELKSLAEQFPLPRTIFFLADESTLSSSRDMLGATSFSSLWLSDNPPKVVPVLRSHVGSQLQQSSETPADLPMLLMALYVGTHATPDSL